jgi:hypothetical protein
MIVHRPSEKRRLAMNEWESRAATAQELVAIGKQRGVDLSATHDEGAFFTEGRFIQLCRKEGRIHYNMQGRIGILPEKMKASASAFHGMWVERGSSETIEQAFEFLKAWLLERKEIDDLPSRSVRSYGI